MWTYRPADNTPMQREKGPFSAAQHTAPARTQTSEPVFRSQNSSLRRQAAYEQKYRSNGEPDCSRPEPIPRTTYDVLNTSQTIHRPQLVAQSKPLGTLRSCCIMGCLYLVGLAAGSLCSMVLSEPLLTYARYFASIDLNLRTTGNAAMVFSVGFLSLFCQLTLVLITGFCVLGVGLIPVTMVLKGAGAGIFTALLYQQLGPTKGLLLQALVFWLPETLGSIIVIVLSASALQVSGGLLVCCLGRNGSGLGIASRHLFHRYLALCLVSMLVCALSVVLTLVFGSLF